MTPSPAREPRGFTLVEALLALALTAMLAALTSTFLSTLARARTHAQTAASELRSVGVLLDRLEDDLAASIAGGRGLGSGIRGSATQVQVLSRGVGIPTDPRLGEGAARAELSDLRGTQFSLDGSTISGRRWIGPDAAGQPSTVAEGISGLRFRYFDGRRWAAEFDSSASGALPVAVEVSVWCAANGPMATGEIGMDAGAALRAPDRWRLITIPDGPVPGEKEGAAS